MKSNRRDFLRTGVGAACLTLGFDALTPPILRRRIFAAPANPKKRFLFIFQRGGMDGLNAVIPRGDAEYNQINRPTLFVPEGSASDLGNGFAQLHPQLNAIREVYESGTLAIVHRVGYRGQSRSHFDSQKYWENGTLDNKLSTGIFNRHLGSSEAVRGNRFPAASLDRNPLLALSGPVSVPNFANPNDFGFRGNDSHVAKFLGRLPTSRIRGRGFLGAYGGAHDLEGKPNRNALYDAGVTLADTVNVLRENDIDPARYRPENGAAYPNGQFGDHLKTAAQLFKRTSVQIVGVNLNGWDTHTAQAGAFNGLLAQIAMGFRALARDLDDQWDDTVVATMSEFGRTSRENGSQGTDHAEATAMFLAGGKVNGGVYNCDQNTWRSGDMFSTANGRYVAHRTDFRSILGEIFREHFGDSEKVIQQVIP
ncbi:MAG: DUF1501 domain-containing protein, partial [Planctomycetota bacterium]